MKPRGFILILAVLLAPGPVWSASKEFCRNFQKWLEETLSVENYYQAESRAEEFLIGAIQGLKAKVLLPEMLAPPLQEELLLRMGVQNTKAGLKSLSDPVKLDALIKTFDWKDWRGNRNQAIDKAVGKMNEANARLLKQRYEAEYSGALRTDIEDMNRGYGFQLLRRDHPTFYEPEYLNGIQLSAGQTGQIYGGHHVKNLSFQFEKQWERFSRSKIVSFQLTGSDANQMLAAIGERFYRIKMKLQGKVLPKEPQLLVFEGSYAAGRGPLMERGQYVRTYHPEEFIDDGVIPGCHSDVWDAGGPAASRKMTAKELAALVGKEKKALEYIRKRVEKAAPPVSGILIEPILGGHGVYFYRPEFMKNLRSLADELQIPIMVDEVLTGGGRTGKFFAYEHFPGFEPDLISFGKGLQVAGVAYYPRHGQMGEWMQRATWGMGVTLTSYDASLLTSIQVLKAIEKENLMANAAKQGEVLIRHLKTIYDIKKKHGGLRSGHTSPRGKGLLIFEGTDGPQVSMAGRRLLPHLDVTDAEIESIYGKYVQDLKSKTPEEIRWMSYDDDW